MIVTLSGVWVLDELQPVAAVLDPDTGALRRLVSWAQLPPPPPGEDVVVCGDGDGLWVQNGRLGPLVRVDLDGVATTVWTEGLLLAAAGAGSAWCTSPAPPQDLVHGAEAEPVVFGSSAVVARVNGDGGVQRVFTDAPVSAVLTSEEALWVQLDVAPWTLHNLGAETYEVVWSRRWLPLAWTGDLPDRVDAAAGQSEQPAATPARLGGDGRWHGYLYDPEADPDSDEAVAGGGLLWRLWFEPPTEEGRPRRGTIAAAFRTTATADVQDTVEPLQVFQLGDGIRAVAAVGEHLLVVTNEAPPDGEPSQVGDLHPRESLGPCVVALRPGAEQAQVWFTSDDIDISALSWPLPPRPLDADSYTQQVLARWNQMDQHWLGPDGWHPLTQGVSGSRARLVGDWPATQVEFTFDYAPRPGVRLRRSFALFDEVGAIANPEYADIGLMEDLDTGRTPPLEDARDGYLDM